MDVVIDNLLVLGFKESVHVNSFDASNVKLFEKVLFFLISQLDCSAVTVWPILVKKDQVPFRKEVSNFFKTLNEPLFVAAEVTALMLSPRGPKCHKFLLTFTQYVLEAKIRRLDPSWNRPELDAGTIVLQKINLLASYQENRTLKMIGFYKKENDMLNACYQDLIQQYKKLSKDFATRTNKMKGITKIDETALEERIQKLASDISELNFVLEKMSKSSENVSFTVQKKNEKQEPYCVNLQTLNVQMPSTLTDYLEKHSGPLEKDSSELFSSDTLNMCSLLSYSNLALELYKEQLESNQSFTSNSQSHDDYDTQLEQLVDQLAQLKMTVDTELTVFSM